MDLKRDYDKLYQHWLNEFEKTDLTELNQNLFIQYNKIINSINNHQESSDDDLRFQVFETYKQKFNFMFNDLLKMRELKIINSALALKDITIVHVSEAEKLLYQSLISSIKGFKKVRAISSFEESENLEELLESDEVGETVQQDKIETTQVNTIIENKAFNKSELISEQSKEKINYSLIRFLINTPPLVGIDLLNYGPFEKEDIAYIPTQNAKILIIEKFAEKIAITEPYLNFSSNSSLK